MSNLCKNCNSETTDLYCAHCGQSTSTKRIDWAFSFRDFFFSNLKLHKGLLYTIKSLIVNPKKMVEDYLAGKRIYYTSAVHFFLFVMIVKAIVALISGHAHTTEPGKVMINGVSSDIDLKHYLKPMIIIFASVSSIGNYLAFKSRKYNLAEHFFINFYIVGMCFLISVVLNIVTLYKYPDTVTLIMLLVILSYYIRTFYDKKLRVVDFLKGIWCLIMNMLIALILLIIGALIYAYQHNMLKDAIQINL